MKTLLIILALVALNCTSGRPPNLEERLVGFKAKIAERQKKWKALIDDEREKSRRDFNREKEVLVGFAPVSKNSQRKNFESLSPEQHEDIKKLLMRPRFLTIPRAWLKPIAIALSSNLSPV